MDVVAGTSEMLQRVQDNNQDDQRAPLRDSAEYRDASGQGNIIVGQVGTMEVARRQLIDDMHAEAAALTVLNQAKKEQLDIKKAQLDVHKAQLDVDIWSTCDADYSLQFTKHSKIHDMFTKETDPVAKNILYEEYINACRVCAFPNTDLLDRSEADYMTVYEMII